MPGIEVTIRGRSKNMILSANGQNIHPEEVEAWQTALACDPVSAFGGVLAVLHGGQEVPQPAPADAVQLAVKFIEEYQRDSALGAVDGFVQRFKEVLGVAALGQVDG